MGLRVHGVTEASLTSDCLLHACCSIHGGGWQASRAATINTLKKERGEEGEGRGRVAGGGGVGGRGEGLKGGFGRKMLDSFKLGAKLEFHARSAWTRPPTMGGGGRHDPMFYLLRGDYRVIASLVTTHGPARHQHAFVRGYLELLLPLWLKVRLPKSKVWSLEFRV